MWTALWARDMGTRAEQRRDSSSLVPSATSHAQVSASQLWTEQIELHFAVNREAEFLSTCRTALSAAVASYCRQGPKPLEGERNAVTQRRRFEIARGGVFGKGLAGFSHRRVPSHSRWAVRASAHFVLGLRSPGGSHFSLALRRDP